MAPGNRPGQQLDASERRGRAERGTRPVIWIAKENGAGAQASPGSIPGRSTSPARASFQSSDSRKDGPGVIAARPVIWKRSTMGSAACKAMQTPVRVRPLPQPPWQGRILHFFDSPEQTGPGRGTAPVIWAMKANGAGAHPPPGSIPGRPTKKQYNRRGGESGMALRWFDLRSAYGSITVKARSENDAKKEAAERWGCGTDEIICIGHAPFGSQWVKPLDRSRV